MPKTPKKILVIDDDPGTCRTLEKWLTVAGRETLISADGETGLERARLDQPDLILLDIMLPGIGGMEVAKQLLSEDATRDIPVIFISAYIGLENDKGDERIEVEGQHFRVFAKPLHNPKLLAEIRKAINRREHGNPEPE